MNRFIGVCLWAFVAVATAMCQTVQVAHGEDVGGDSDASAPEKARLLDTVLLACAANRDKLGAVEFKVIHVDEIPGVKEPRTITQELPGGNIITITEVPKQTREARVVVWGDRIRHERAAAERAGTRTFAFDGAVWTELDPVRRLVTDRRRDQLPGMEPLDPIELVSFDHRFSLEMILRQGNLIDARMVKIERDGRDATLCVVEVNGPVTNRFSVEFDEAVDLLPTRSIVYHMDQQSVSRVTDVSYQRVPQRDAWLVSHVVGRQFDPGKTATPALEGYNALSQTDVREIHLIDAAQATSDLFRVDVPEGYLRVDHTALPAQQEGPQPGPEHARRPLIANLLMGGGGLVISLLLLLAVRKLRARPARITFKEKE